MKKLRFLLLRGPAPEGIGAGEDLSIIFGAREQWNQNQGGHQEHGQTHFQDFLWREIQSKK
jgi:hypothetical protein